MERTLAIIKPDGVGQGLIGAIISRIEQDGLKIVGMRMQHLTARETEGFYYVHRDKPFFNDLVAYMTSGPVVLMVLSGPEAIQRWRDLMGATDPQKAAPGTIRREMGTNIERNVVHGSDSKESAVFEINYFFKGTEIVA
ncbi:MAG TPA: nucleoside-diphosphate kinase [Caldithrix abyssi]|uniref:Nucleoside diphosphate kinase n=1 Tax=Caldithrix abyssi TaxID=187145 RepID=A0A7V5PN65_CALAY|nr:nucleoside-diphosphate kinase [Caldithrix abyssi]